MNCIIGFVPFCVLRICSFDCLRDFFCLLRGFSLAVAVRDEGQLERFLGASSTSEGGILANGWYSEKSLEIRWEEDYLGVKRALVRCASPPSQAAVRSNLMMTDGGDV